MVSKIILLIFSVCFLVDYGSSYRIKQNAEDLKEYIIRGESQAISDAIHHVQLIANFNNSDGRITSKFFCGGSLITNDIVLTAAHCMEPILNTKNLEVYAGSEYLLDYVEKRSWKSILIHPYYTKINKLDKDIAMIKVDKPFASPLIAPIPLNMAPPKDFEKATINGFGVDTIYKPEPNVILKKLTGTLVNCTHPKVFTRTDICLKTPIGHGACMGDSGGGLVNSKLELIGIAARVYAPCGSYEMDWYTSVYDHLNFIVAGLQRLSPDDELAMNIVNKVNKIFTRLLGRF